MRLGLRSRPPLAPTPRTCPSRPPHATMVTSAHLATIVAEHERRLNHVRKREHLRLAEHELEQGEDALRPAAAELGVSAPILRIARAHVGKSLP